MSLLLEKLNNIRSLRAMSREFSIDVLEDMLAKLRTVTEEKRAEEQAAQAQQAEYQEKINTWLELMTADGITPEELVGHATATSKGGKSASRVRLNIVLPIIPAPRKPGPGRDVCRSRSLKPSLRVNPLRAS